ncbi:ribosomal protein S18-alanine N-acetyltransferase [Bartonella tamiae]|uniref:Ribosomal-protein-alanine acetyltransferase n=1 Tax=Bartonella tamiae Th239 TaxID=1094558 RepID=J0R6A8_9HYPH|nr:ribosomal protein S18-alanine N-acetyltransferase [Bartonella tamiae]EJF91249.1 ribosomal-protein-alanine acetyltransferase [Bartonella tamiae Th239]EJF93086.1 ribosomal-protein-alanine acetyltransferase [Bartonella tamiae Th307]
MVGFPFLKNNFSITHIEKDDVGALEAVHQTAFFDSWNAETFLQFLSDPQIFGYVLRLVGQPKRLLGFVLCRLVLQEAEIITIAVHPYFRSRGVGKDLLEAVLRHLYRERATSLFLEVDETNKAALHLYHYFSFQEIGRRPAYYQTSSGRNDALIMKRSFQQKD